MSLWHPPKQITLWLFNKSKFDGISENGAVVHRKARKSRRNKGPVQAATSSHATSATLDSTRTDKTPSTSQRKWWSWCAVVAAISRGWCRQAAPHMIYRLHCNSTTLHSMLQRKCTIHSMLQKSMIRLMHPIYNPLHNPPYIAMYNPLNVESTQ